MFKTRWVALKFFHCLKQSITTIEGFHEESSERRVTSERQRVPSLQAADPSSSSGQNVRNNRRNPESVHNPPLSSRNIHTLRSSHHYQHSVEYRPRPAGLIKAFNDVYIPFREGRTIPEAARRVLDSFTLTSEQYHMLVTDRELPCGQFISLHNGKLIFDEYTLPPHGQVITEILDQISVQNQPKLFQSSTGESLSPLRCFLI